jgi:hypothetical protein
LGNRIYDAFAAKKSFGQRSYRRRDVEIALRIKGFFTTTLFTIAGAKKKLQSEMRETSRLKSFRRSYTERKFYSKKLNAQTVQ